MEYQIKLDSGQFRPSSVPIAPNAVLWFEFLLNSNLLKDHLSKPNPDPSPADLIIKFLTLKPLPQPELNKPPDFENPESPTLSIVETEKYSKKQLAIKVLCLKVAAHLKWDLSVLENILPPQIQSQLMQDLIYMATDGTYLIPPPEASKDFLERGGVKFAFVLYHRWLLRFLVNRASIRTSKQILVWMGPSQTDAVNLQMYEKLVGQAADFRERSLYFMTELADNHKFSNEYKSMKVPTIDTFAMLNEDTGDVIHDWDTSKVCISEHEFYMQLNYDVCVNYFFYREYSLAEKHILMCNKHMEILVKEKHPEYPHKDGFNWSKMDYASVTEKEINGYMKALNISHENKTLLHQLHEAVADNYEGLIHVLQSDNLKREIPMVHRTVIELDIQGLSSSGTVTVSRDLLNKVAALNVVRSLLDGNLPSAHIDFNKRMKSMGAKFVDNLVWAFAPLLKSDSLIETDKELIKQFFLHLATSEHDINMIEINEILTSYINDTSERDAANKFFSDAEIKTIMKDLNDDLSDETGYLTLETYMTGWDTPDFNIQSVPDLELGCLRQRLIDATTAEKIKECLLNIAFTNPAQPPWIVNPQWKLPMPLQNVILSLPRGFLQDFCYVIMGKARQQAEMGEYNSALQLLLLLETDMRNQLNQSSAANSNGSPNNSVMYKLWKLVGWEALLLQINQMLADWPNQKNNMIGLINKCTLCIIALQSSDSVIPRMEIVEQCFICLLNGGEWKKLAELASGSRGTGQAEAAVATALAAHHLHTKPMKKLPEDLWDMVFPIFVNVQSSSSTKRNSSGNPISSRDSAQANNKMKDGMTAFFSKLRDPTVLSVVISLLAKLFNIQKDDSNMDLNMEYINLWPAKVSSTISLTMVSNSLHHLVAQALKYYPNNISWIKLLGDMSLVGGHYSIAMKQYLTALTILSDNFIQPLSKQLIEDQTIFRRMIKCCTQLNCPTQAAILCQFLEEIDYVLAFKCLSEMSHLCSDAMDSYYGCIWDTSILEYLINLHHKRGETHRKQLAVKVMGMLELNSNNNEEIQREAANKRKAKFMRALVKQYVC